MIYKTDSSGFLNWRLSKGSAAECYQDEAVKRPDFTLAPLLKYIFHCNGSETFPQLLCDFY